MGEINDVTGTPVGQGPLFSATAPAEERAATLFSLAETGALTRSHLHLLSQPRVWADFEAHIEGLGDGDASRVGAALERIHDAALGDPEFQVLVHRVGAYANLEPGDRWEVGARGVQTFDVSPTAWNLETGGLRERNDYTPGLFAEARRLSTEEWGSARTTIRDHFDATMTPLAAIKESIANAYETYSYEMSGHIEVAPPGLIARWAYYRLKDAEYREFQRAFWDAHPALRVPEMREELAGSVWTTASGRDAMTPIDIRPIDVAIAVLVLGDDSPERIRGTAAEAEHVLELAWQNSELRDDVVQ
ncbi:MAG: hypothetical protein AAF658_05150, partial [Myxococcota bacterium]